tara:strand:+ start:4527 stop:4820 length:294 start_codon:yes stop_codon:yes gene_type:complete
MNLYLVKNKTNNVWGTYSSMVVSAESEYNARRIHPNRHIKHNKEKGYWYILQKDGNEFIPPSEISWVFFKDIDKLEVECIGSTMKPKGVIRSDYTAG